MTEDEAKTKWCAFGRAVGSLCIGSACMAWRWLGERTVPADISTFAAHMREHEVGPLDAVGATSRKVADGYCGLAGVPA